MKAWINRADPGIEAEAEKILLGLILKSNTVPVDINITYFTGSCNKKIFETIKKVSETIPPDIRNISLELKKEGADSSLISYVVGLTDTPVYPSQIDYYKNMVIENSREAQMKELCLKCVEGKESISNVLDKMNELNISHKKLSQVNKFYTGLDIVTAVDSINEWIVPGLIAIGLTVISGASKIGKSWLALGLWLAVQNGNIFLSRYETNKSSCLYLSLEDNKKRLKKRLNITTQNNKELLQPESYITTSFSGCVKELRSFLEGHPEIRLVIIDTLIKFKPSTDMGDYSQTTRVQSDLKDIADDLQIAMVVISHTKKGSFKATEDEDPFDYNLGSTGIFAAADAMMILKKKARAESEAELIITGRDFEDSSIVLDFDKSLGSWTYKGDKVEIQNSNARQEIYDYIKDNPSQTPSQIHKGMEAEGAKLTAGALKVTLKRMVSDGILINKDGYYSVNEYTKYTEYTVYTGIQAEKSDEKEIKQTVLDLQPGSYDSVIAEDIFKLIEKQQDENIDIGFITQMVNGDTNEILRSLD